MDFQKILSTNRRVIIILSVLIFSIQNSTVIAGTWLSASNCHVIGDWNEVTQTCTMTADYDGGININHPTSGITLDGNGHTITYTQENNDQRGVLIGGYQNTVKNLNIIGTSTTQAYYGAGIFIFGYYDEEAGNNNTISNVTISGASIGITARYGADNNNITDNIIFDVQSIGVEIGYESNGNNITGNVVSSNYISTDYYCSDCNDGIQIQFNSNNNTISSNTISKFNYGVKDDSASNVFNNNFIDISYVPIVNYSGSGTYNNNYYSDYDEVIEGCTDSNQDGICDAPYQFIAWMDATDYSPWVNPDGWLTTSDASGTVTSDSGGTVSTDDGGVVIDILAGAVDGDVTITVELVDVTEPDIIIGNSTNTATALAIYEFGPDGTEFTTAAAITLIIDVTDLSYYQRALISIYRHEDTDNDGDIDSDDGYVEIPNTVCEISAGDYDTDIATCTASIEHFSTYAIILPDDTDGDGIADSNDMCPLEDATGFDIDNDGCIDDTDGDGINDPQDLCPAEDATGFDIDNDGCIDDTDGDGINDPQDLCPTEDATGFDIDNDGCIDSIHGLTEMVTQLVNSGVISENMKNSLISKVENADKSISKDNTCAAVNQLQALQNQIEAQMDKKLVSDIAADDIINYTNSIIANFNSQLPIDESCA